MAYFSLQNFKFGLDVRRSELTSQAGTLAKAENGHINQGGEFEKRKAFVNVADYPTTFGMQPVSGGIAVFGSDADPGVEAPFVYVRCQHPDVPTASMQKVVASTNYQGKSYVICYFGEYGFVTFYDGVAVDDLSPGRLALVLTNETTLAEYFASLINAGGVYTATNVDGVLTITGAQGSSFSVLAENNSVCTTALDTTPPNVVGVEVSSIVFTITTAHDGQLHQNAVVYHDSSTDPTIDGINYDFGDDMGAGAGVTAYDLSEYAAWVIAEGPAYVGGDHCAFVLDMINPTSVIVHALITYSNSKTQTFDWTLADFALNGTEEWYVRFVLAADAAQQNPTMVANLASDGTAPVTGTVPQAQFSVIAIKPSGTGKVTSIVVDEGGAGEQEILGTAATDLSGANYATAALLATAIKTQINTYCVAHTLSYSASASNNVVVVRATANFTAMTGKSLVVKTNGDLCFGTLSLTFAQVPGSATIPTVTSLQIGGVNVMTSGSITGTDLADFVSNLSDDINAASGYCGVAIGQTLYLSKFNTSSSDLAQSVNVSITDGIVSGSGGGTGSGGGSLGLNATCAYVDTFGVTRTQYKWVQKKVGTRYAYSVSITCKASGGVPPYKFDWSYDVFDGHYFWPTVVGNYPTLKLAAADYVNTVAWTGIKCTITDAAGNSFTTQAVSVLGTTTDTTYQ